MLFIKKIYGYIKLKYRNPVTKFLIKAITIYFAWYILYELIILPDGQLDKWISITMAKYVHAALSIFGYNTFHTFRTVGIEGSNGVELIDGCNGLAAIGLFIGFVLAYPKRGNFRYIFIVFGIIILFITNFLRTLFLALIEYELNHLFYFFHDFFSTMIFYVIIFVMWIFYANYKTSS